MLDIFFQSKYHDLGSFPFTVERDPRRKKDIGYYISKCEAIYTPYINNFCSIPYASVSDFEILRRYADDDQPEEMYERYIKQFHKDKDMQKIGTHIDIIEAKKKSYYNVNYEVVSTAKKIKDTLVGLFESKEFKISADPIDLHSKTLVEDAEMELWALVDNQDFLKAYNKMAGLQNQDPSFVPESQDEMDVYKETGGFKPNYAKAMEKAIKFTRDISNWNEIKKLMAADKITTQYECCRDYYDPEDCLIKTRYVDPATLIIQWSEFPDHHDSNFAGQLYVMNISEVRQWIPNMPEKFYRDLAYAYCGYSTNPAIYSWKLYDQQNASGVYGYEFFKVLCLYAEWIDIDSTHDITFPNKRGKPVTKEVDYDTTPEEFMPNIKLEDKVERFTDIRRRFACKWFVGTDIVFDWGPSYDVVRPSKRDVSLTFHVYRHPGRKSLMKRLKPLFDNYQILWLKLQNALAYARNTGGLFNATAIMSVAKSKEERAAWMRQYLESGYNFFAETQSMQMKNTSMQPFFPDPGGIGKIMEDIRVAYALNGQMIESMTGLNPLSMGSTPDPNAPVQTTMAAVQAMSNTLRTYFSGYMTLCKEHAESVSRLIQLKIKYSPDSRKAYTGILGDMDVKLLQTAETDGVMYGIILQPLPDDMQKQEIYKQIQIALQPGADGSTKITQSDALILTGMLQSDQPLKNIAFEFAMREKKNQRLQMQQKKELMQTQADLNDKNAQTSAKLARDNNDADSANKIREIQETNKGLIGKTATGESIKQTGNIAVAHIRTDGKKEEVAAE